MIYHDIATSIRKLHSSEIANQYLPNMLAVSTRLIKTKCLPKKRLLKYAFGFISDNLKAPSSTLTDSKQATDYSNNYFTEKTKNRNSFHQNVEEALSSLLWQPYEYQNQNNNEYNAGNNGNDYESSHYSTW